ncbi:MAG TPA: hypothetical protein DEF45_03395 [Rhodopirellula sp.]|nr:MAG: hypothetical protein CBD74_12035 [Saprospirales bacterium TMED214]HBV62047.1 hypothetical protein [Rhodopirellula sp.]
MVTRLNQKCLQIQIVSLEIIRHQARQLIPQLGRTFFSNPQVFTNTGTAGHAFAEVERAGFCLTVLCIHLLF